MRVPVPTAGRGQNDGGLVVAVVARPVTVGRALVYHGRCGGRVRHVCAMCGVHGWVVMLAGQNGAHRRSGVVRPRDRIRGGSSERGYGTGRAGVEHCVGEVFYVWCLTVGKKVFGVEI